MHLHSQLEAISPLDGRYFSKCQELSPFVSEFGLMHYRVLVEIKWLETLSEIKEIAEVPPLSAEAKHFLQRIIQDFNLEQAAQIKEIEKTTNHDLKSVEYFLKTLFDQNTETAKIKEFVHFACTSEDINNLSYGLMLKDIREKCLLPLLLSLKDKLHEMAKDQAKTPMLSRTHGQVATPTTVGKEIANVVARLSRQIKQLEALPILGKLNGAVGNFNAHTVAYPECAWDKIAQNFVENLGLTYNPLTTQIEPHDNMAEYFHCLNRISTILIDFSRDIWGYISMGYFQQKAIKGEVGSSTMPHKVNPIDFENAEGNLGISQALLTHFADKLPISRWQRDLSDSTVLRNIGVGIGHFILSLKSLQQGLNKLAVNTDAITSDLNQNWEILAEAIQTVMRRYQISQPYEKLKELTRDKIVNAALLHRFIDSLTIPPAEKERLLALRPSQYLGLAEKLVNVLEEMK